MSCSVIFMISCLRAAGAETQGGDEEDGSWAEPRLPPDATDPEAGCGEFAAAAGELTYEFVTHCQCYLSSPFHCRVDSPPCRCAHGTRRHAQSRVVLRRSPTTLPPQPPPPPRPGRPKFQRWIDPCRLSACIHRLSHRRVACEAAQAPRAIPVLSALLDEI